jgi:hypothetical protein
VTRRTLILSAAALGGVETDYADKVLLPRFAAAFNEWALAHKPKHATIDAKDLERWRAAVKAFKELVAAYKEAGYQ